MTDKSLTLYGIKTCATCRKALAELEADGWTVAWVDVRKDADLDAKLPHWFDQTSYERLINKASMTWRNLDEASKKAVVTHAGALAILKANPTLIKRPVIEHERAVYVGWTKDVRAALGFARDHS
jgi:arsenate reductase